MSVHRDLKLVFQDIDGCMNTPDGSDLSSAAEGGLTSEQARLLGEIGRAIDASWLDQVVLNTGRSLDAVHYIADALGTDKVRYMLTEHAAYGFDSHAESALDLVQLAERSGMHELAARYAGLDQIAAAIGWYSRIGESLLSERFGVSLPALPKAANLTVGVPEGISSVELIEGLQELVVSTPDLDSEGLIYHENQYYVDVVCGVGKGDGALLMLELLGMVNRDALAAGDGLNDLSMFEALERGFCPANAAGALKEACRAKGGTVSSQSYGAATLEFYRSLG